MKNTKKIFLITALSILTATAAYAYMYSDGALYKGQLVPVNSTAMSLSKYKIVIEEPKNDNLKTSYKHKVKFRASIMDSNGKNIQNLPIKWESNRDGNLGEGAEITTQLSKGTHKINCIAKDFRGNESSSNINITAENIAPHLKIKKPVSLNHFSYGSTVPMRVNIHDYEDQTIPDVAVSWKSNINGEIGRGKSLNIKNLSPGTHKITVTAKDSEGLETSASTTISIEQNG